MNISTEDIINSTKIYQPSALNYKLAPHKMNGSSTLLWSGYDNEDTYAANLKNNYNQLKEYGWLDREIIYKFNSDGFRCDEFDTTGGIAFFGCSFTMGEGAPLENTWPYLVAKSLNLPYYNFGLSGSSADMNVRLALHYLPKLKPSIVVFLYPPDDRIEYIKDEYPQHLMASQMIDLDLNLVVDQFEAEYYKRWISSDTNRILLRLKNTFTMKQLSEIIGAKFVFRDQNQFKTIDLGRDLAHQGIKSHGIFANEIIEAINNNEERLI